MAAYAKKPFALLITWNSGEREYYRAPAQQQPEVFMFVRSAEKELLSIAMTKLPMEEVRQLEFVPFPSVVNDVIYPRDQLVRIKGGG